MLGSFWAHVGIILGSCWDHVGVNLGSVWDQFGISLGSIWDRIGVNLGSFWHRSGTNDLHQNVAEQILAPESRSRAISWGKIRRISRSTRSDWSWASKRGWRQRAKPLGYSRLDFQLLCPMSSPGLRAFLFAYAPPRSSQLSDPWLELGHHAVLRLVLP